MTSCHDGYNGSYVFRVGFLLAEEAAMEEALFYVFIYIEKVFIPLFLMLKAVYRNKITIPKH